jgi:DNA replication protein DnaC
MGACLPDVLRQSQNRVWRRWENVCPVDFRNTDARKLPKPELLRCVLAWTYGARGLLLHGNTGLGKSRCAWLLLKREHDAGRRIRVIDHSIGFRYAELFANSAGDAAAWIERLCEADILFLDDVFKARLTDSLEQALFTIISTRCEQQRPNIITTNDTGESLKARMSQDRGDAIYRRLTEYSQAVAFA